MVYPQDVEQKLGFDVLRQRLRNYCVSGLGHRRLDEITFQSDYDLIIRLLRQTFEFEGMLSKGDSFPQAYFFDPGDLLRTIAIEESFIESEEMLRIALSLQTVFDCKVFLEKTKEEYPELHLLSVPVTLPKAVPQNITARIDENGTVKDNASPELARLRRQLRDEQGKVRRITEQIYRNALQQGWVPDGVPPTVRDGRVVIPVAAEHKRKLRGFIIDESATGQTVYMEPAEVLEANNEIRDLEHAARREVVRILKELTKMLRGVLPEIELAYTFLGHWEIFARKRSWHRT